MTRHARLPIALTLLAATLLAALGGCAEQSHASRASQAERTACRNHADEVFSRQNRDAVYRADSYSTGLRDSPFGSSGLPGLSTTGLSQQFGIENTEQDCLNGMGESNGDGTGGGAALPPVTGGRAPATVK